MNVCAVVLVVSMVAGMHAAPAKRFINCIGSDGKKVSQCWPQWVETGCCSSAPACGGGYDPCVPPTMPCVPCPAPTKPTPTNAGSTTGGAPGKSTTGVPNKTDGKGNPVTTLAPHLSTKHPVDKDFHKLHLTTGGKDGEGDGTDPLAPTTPGPLTTIKVTTEPTTTGAPTTGAPTTEATTTTESTTTEDPAKPTPLT